MQLALQPHKQPQFTTTFGVKMSATTTAQLDGAFRRFVRACEDHGADVTDWTLHSGSKTNGVSFYIHTPSSTGLGSGPRHLGFTKSDAFDALARMAGVLEDASFWGQKS